MDRPARTGLFVAAALVLAACASAADRYEEGLQAERARRFDEAALLYLDALDKEEGFEEARARLDAVMDSVVRRTMTRADERLADGDPVVAAEAYRGLDAIYGRADELDIELSRPPDLAPRRRAVLDAAIASLLDEALELADAGRWQASRDALDRAVTYDPTGTLRRRITDQRTRVLAAWAAEELEAGRARTAFGLAEQALGAGGGARRDLELARRVRAEALERGSAVLAVLPVSTTARVGSMSGDLLAAMLGDLLELGYWRRPPAFLAVRDPVEVRRATRNAAFGGGRLNELDIRRILDDVDADLAVMIEIGAVALDERPERRTPVQVRTRDGGTATYLLEEGQARYTADVGVVVMDERGRDVVSFGTREAVQTAYARPVYDGDAGDLVLGRNEALLFSGSGQRAQAERALEELAGRLAEQIGPEVYARVLRQIP